MAGGGKKKSSKSRSRRPISSSALFVQGGLLSDWSAGLDSPPSRGRNANTSSSRNAKSVPKSGNSGKPKASVSKNESQKLKGNAFGYVYPNMSPQEGSVPHGGNAGDDNIEGSQPIVLVDSKGTKIVAYVDQTPDMESQSVKYTYDYGSGFELTQSSHRGLGFSDETKVGSTSKMVENEASSEDEMETDLSYVHEVSNKVADALLSQASSEEEMETDVSYVHGVNTEVADALLSQASSPERNTGFLSIGGMRLYTQDISDEEEDSPAEEIQESSESSGMSSSSDGDGLSDSDSDIDDEVARDYFEGIGGSFKVANVDQLVGRVQDTSYDNLVSRGSFNETLMKMGGIALQDASKEYGLKPRSGRKYVKKSLKSGDSAYDDAAALDDLMLMKNSRTYPGKKKHVSKFPQSWPSEAQKSKNFRRFPGEKKKHRKEMIASKRRERMIRRGVDLEEINLKLEQMVINEVDILSFHLTHSRDCTQVQRLAAIYRLRSGCQGSGKNRFVTVTRTERTGMPSSGDRVRLEKLIGADDEDADLTVNDTIAVKSYKSKAIKVPNRSGSTPVHSKSAQNKSLKKFVNFLGNSEGSKKKRREKTGSYAALPMSFVSSGTMVSETVETVTIDSKGIDNTLHENKGVASSSSYGAFEMHTTGFGSKMMAKMGYVDGGLGKDGRGIAEPIEAIQRPKSLGLGAEVPETNLTESIKVNRRPKLRGAGPRVSETSSRSGTTQFGSFEKHTKGFGSKMMAKMGFVEGTGLGRDSQGIVNPLVAARLPKSRGLGAKG